MNILVYKIERKQTGHCGNVREVEILNSNLSKNAKEDKRKKCQIIEK